MASDIKIRNFMESVMPIARAIELKTGIPAELMSSFMSWETDAGNNAGAKYNNYMGIKFVGQSQATAGKVAGGYAGYNTSEDFVDDVSRIVNMGSYGYPRVVTVSRNDPNNFEGIIKAWNDSSWAESDYNTNEIIRRSKLVGASPSPSSLFNLDFLKGDGSQETTIKYAVIGAGILLAVRMLTEKEGPVYEN